MKEIIIYDTQNMSDLIMSLKVLIDRIIRCVDTYLVDNHSFSFRAINLRLLTGYEKYQDHYTFNFIDGSVDYNYKNAKRLIGDKIPDGFIQINKNEIINVAYIKIIDEYGVWLAYNSRVKRISDKYRNKLLEKLDLK